MRELAVTAVGSDRPGIVAAITGALLRIGGNLEDARAALLRGSRMDETTPGSGLGLSIVVELTRAYDGRISLADSDLGGLKAMLELPAAEA